MLSSWICAQLIFSGIFHSTSAILGGKVASPGQFKYLVEIFVYDKGSRTICGGAVLDGTHVLTAAHCVSNFDKKDLFIIAGTNDLLSERGIGRKIAKIHIHEKYKSWENVGKIKYHKMQFADWLLMKPKRPPLENDIAVLRLVEALPLGQHISSVGLPVAPVLPYHKTIPFAAWGRESANTSTNILRWTNFKIMDDSECYTRTKYDFRHQFCVMDPTEKSCTLQGDSGAPLVYNGIVIGVFSHSYRSPNAPAMFMKVFEYVQFIKKTLKDRN